MRGKWMLLSAAVVLLGVAAGAVSLLRRDAAAKAASARTQQAAAPQPVEVTFPARTQARTVVAAGVPVSGTIAEFLVDVGEEVEEGQLMARISNHELESAREAASLASETAQARLSKAESGVIAARLEASRARADGERARAEFERTDKLYRRQKILVAEGATPRLVFQKSEREFQEAKGEYDSLDVLARQAEEHVTALVAQVDEMKKVLADKARDLEAAQANLKAAEVHAPVSGMVVARHGEAGKEVDQSESGELFQIAPNPAELVAVAEPEPPVVARVRPGGLAVLFFADMANEGIQGSVREVKGNQVLIDFLSPNPMVKPGVTLQVRLKLD